MMRGLAGVLSMVVLVLGGIALAVAGGFQLWEDHGIYQVGFKEPGEGCGIQDVEIDVRSGKPLFCTSLPMALNTSEASFQGFTDEQNSNVLAQAEQLAEVDGLSNADQRKIQGTVDTYAATVPKDRRRQHSFWWGINNLIGGLGAAGLGGLILAGLRSRMR
jgi:hypothetical protein